MIENIRTRRIGYLPDDSPAVSEMVRAAEDNHYRLLVPINFMCYVAANH